uniref:NADH-ubiquinone oxidoreductase chain 1 n=1 Tax=Micronecta sahlbergii TaxID=2304347 RepID=A0A346LZL0_9HEMI|nr:NADH dehydrogenase subunit 1 [Micronecta sahlbergii]AXQ02205.1 NADH dehydrogenase subunit 1 [Micronecta sahlbergii]
MYLISYIFLIIMILVGVAFVTLLERKLLGYIQLRKGPNKVGVLGLLQPFSDGLKLFFKEQTNLISSNFYIYYLTPIFMLFFSFSLWILFPFMGNSIELNLGVLYFFCITGLGVYGTLMCGWSSNSNYALLGGLRSVAQTISYEVSMALIMICILIFIFSFNLYDFIIYQKTFWFMFLSFPLFFCWFSSILAETNRAPFDFAEGESELVSGFNIEYSSGGFAYIFLSEYMNIIFMSTLTCIIFLGCDIYSIFFYFKVISMIFLYIWVRGTLPRFRYDKLMYLTWKLFLPFSLMLLMINLGILLTIFVY